MSKLRLAKVRSLSTHSQASSGTVLWNNEGIQEQIRRAEQKKFAGIHTAGALSYSKSERQIPRWFQFGGVTKKSA